MARSTRRPRRLSAAEESRRSINAAARAERREVARKTKSYEVKERRLVRTVRRAPTTKVRRALTRVRANLRSLSATGMTTAQQRYRAARVRHAEPLGRVITPAQAATRPALGLLDEARRRRAELVRSGGTVSGFAKFEINGSPSARKQPINVNVTSDEWQRILDARESEAQRLIEEAIIRSKGLYSGSPPRAGRTKAGQLYPPPGIVKAKITEVDPGTTIE